MKRLNNLTRIIRSSDTPSPLVGEGWGEGASDHSTLSLALSPQDRRGLPQKTWSQNLLPIFCEGRGESLQRRLQSKLIDARRLISIILTLLLTTPAAQAEGLGRLFFTPAQRAQLNSHHYLPTPAVTTPEVLADAPDAEHSLTVNGIVQRSGGKRTAWINGAAKTVEQGDENPTSVMVNLPDQNKKVRLKVGQRVILTPPANTNATKPSAEEPAPASED